MLKISQIPDTKRISKFLSYILRHHPEEIGIALDNQGWANVNELIEKSNSQRNLGLTPEILNIVIKENDKQRFALDETKTKIRASQGHSVPIDLGYNPVKPPDVLYHGTAQQFIPLIEKQGITKGSRTHVHLSQDTATAINVGKRHGKPIVLLIRSGAMHNDGYEFYLSDNNVWLTEYVPIKYIGKIN